MAKEKKVNKEGVVSPAHVLKLLDKIGIECNSSFFDANSRKVMKDKIGQIVPLLDLMDERDETYQRIPEVMIPALKEELKKNDALLKKNHENVREQIQIGLYQKGYPTTSPMYDTFLEKMKLDLEDAQIKVDSNIELITPTFKFQTNERWKEIQLEYNKRNVKAIKDNIKETETQIELVKKDITEQTERMKARRLQIIEELKDLKEDVSEFTGKTPEYIG